MMRSNVYVSGKAPQLVEHYADSLTKVCMRKSLRNCGPGDTLTEFEFHSCVLCFF